MSFKSQASDTVSMWSVVVRSVLALLLISFIAMVFESSMRVHAQPVPSSSQPKWMAELKKYGWSAPKPESNKTFFKDFSYSKLDAVDIRTRLLFVSNDRLIVYHTKEEGPNWRTATRYLEAFFVNAKDGELSSAKQWPTSVRKSFDDLRDSESRLIALSNDRLLVLANGIMMLYASDLNLINQQALQQANSTDFWAVQGVDRGREIFVRHESSTGPRVTYEWLESDTFKLLYEMPGYQDHDFSVQGGVVAGEKAVFTGSRSGIRMIARDQQPRTICDDQLCRGDTILNVITPHLLGFSGKTGVGLVDESRGLVWSKSVELRDSAAGFQFSRMRSALSGTRFAFWVMAYRKSTFDSVDVSSSPTLLVYDTNTLQRILVIRTARESGDFDFALSPDGKKLAVFDGARVALYAVD